MMKSMKSHGHIACEHSSAPFSSRFIDRTRYIKYVCTCLPHCDFIISNHFSLCSIHAMTLPKMTACISYCTFWDIRLHTGFKILRIYMLVWICMNIFKQNESNSCPTTLRQLTWTLEITQLNSKIIFQTSLIWGSILIFQGVRPTNPKTPNLSHLLQLPKQSAPWNAKGWWAPWPQPLPTKLWQTQWL